MLTYSQDVLVKVHLFPLSTYFWAKKKDVKNYGKKSDSLFAN